MKRAKMKCLNRISQFHRTLQYDLLPKAEQSLGLLSEKHKKLISILELIRIEEHIPRGWFCMGRPRKDRHAMARAFIAKVIFRIQFTCDLIVLLQNDLQLRVICGWANSSDVPSEAKFSRVFH